jgi:hypothetical protein
MSSFDKRVRRNKGHLATFIVDNSGVVTDTNDYIFGPKRHTTTNTFNKGVFAEFADFIWHSRQIEF